MLEDVPRIFEAVFQCTLEVGMLFLCLLLLLILFNYVMMWHLLIYSVSHQMITKNFEDYPEHRLKFFSLLRAIGTHCFQALIQLSSQVSSNLFCFLALR
jgi:exportin-1